MSKSNVICGAKNILATSMSLILQNYFFITVKDQHGATNRNRVPASGICDTQAWWDEPATHGKVLYPS